ncbi:hypothetical protein LTR36_000763 [Oleoguttula mirabilis]|uniref:ubiquitinyl hydrolase 1 n=1 Tax=Oleoguttula mirabilis TaxID=1507867 RepID=A0AAV9J415_9PEZI|nr:hypothetical protein LTR36_000763 [Oleoguttula mirabilis]
MDRRARLDDLHLPDTAPSASTTVIYTILALYAIHQLLVYFDYAILSPQEIVWNALVHAVPKRLLLDAAKRQELRANDMLSQTHAAKGEALRRILGFGTGALSHKLSGGEGVMRKMSAFTASEAAATTDAPPGLGNWDNSCYQNSVLQGLASLGSLGTYLGRSGPYGDASSSTNASLRETVAKLNDSTNNGKQLWTPAKLKSMSSWQQQDAQEYFSKIMDELDKEAGKAVSSEKAKCGLEVAVEERTAKVQQSAVTEEQEASNTAARRNPLEGLLAQRVACTRCGFSEGLSMIPFNCLTVPLGSDNVYDLAECLDEYTKLEEINEVDCAKCTLLRAEGQLRQMVPTTKQATQQNDGSAAEVIAKKTITLPPELRVLAAKRLQAMQQALETDDFSDTSLNETCQIPKKAHVSSTKTRQAVVGRSPQSLVVHINRSVFDELTGVQRKNYATVRYPMLLDLGAWTLGEDRGSSGHATQSMLAPDSDEPPCLYRLKAVVTHYGRHENGHYICYRKHPVRPTQDAGAGAGDVGDTQVAQEKWWRLSDEDVSSVTEGDVLARGDAFMLFYEREDVLPKLGAPAQPVAAVTERVPDELHVREVALEEAAAIPLPAEEADEEVKAGKPALPCPTETSPWPRDSPCATSPQPSTVVADQPSTNTAAENEPCEAADQQQQQSIPAAAATLRKTPTPPLMRTSRGRKSSRQASRGEAGFTNNAFRPMAAT